MSAVLDFSVTSGPLRVVLLVPCPRRVDLPRGSSVLWLVSWRRRSSTTPSEHPGCEGVHTHPPVWRAAGAARLGRRCHPTQRSTPPLSSGQGLDQALGRGVALRNPAGGQTVSAAGPTGPGAVTGVRVRVVDVVLSLFCLAQGVV